MLVLIVSLLRLRSRVFDDRDSTAVLYLWLGAKQICGESRMTYGAERTSRGRRAELEYRRRNRLCSSPGCSLTGYLISSKSSYPLFRIAIRGA